MKKIVRTVCQGCHEECGVLVDVVDGRASRVTGDPAHPKNHGFTCLKGRAYPDVLYHPDRLKYPLKRAAGKGEGKWARVSWDEALGEIATKLTEIKEMYGPEAIAAIHGTGPRSSIAPPHPLMYSLGSPNVVSTDCHICWAPSYVAEACTMGGSITMDNGPDYEASSCIVIWGANPEMSHPARGSKVIEAKKKRNVKLIVIDPRRTHLAAMADSWLQIRPGTDGALALAMINVIIGERLYDEEFVNHWCTGFEQLQERVRDCTPEKMGEITWIPAEKIREAARMYALSKPAALHHRVAVEHNVNSVQTCRALSILVALTGNIDVPGGNVFRLMPDGYKSMDVLMGFDKEWRPDRSVAEKGIGSKEFPLISGPDCRAFPFVIAPAWVDTMSTGKPYPIKAMYCAGGNPVLNCQDSRKVWEGLKKLDLFFVADLFMTPTAELADYVLPVTTWLERDECCDLIYPNYMAVRQRVVGPLFECWDDLKIVIELVKRIPWANRKFLPWDDVNGFYEWLVQGTGFTFAELKEKGYLVMPMRYRKYEEKGFDTPSGKVEFYSTIFEKYGYDPLPCHVEPPESPLSTPKSLEDYPLVLTTGARHLEYFHSEGRQVPRLRKRVPDPILEIHPDAASAAGIEDGDWVWIETPRTEGRRVRFKTKVTRDIDARVVHARHAWWFPERPAPEHGCFDSNINVVISGSPPRNPICGSVATRGSLCRVYK